VSTPASDVKGEGVEDDESDSGKKGVVGGKGGRKQF